jgi:chromosome partitioning protein
MLTDRQLRQDFSLLFSYPLAPTAIPDILAKRDWRRFEQLVDYIFERAGYLVKDVSLERRGNNIDLEIYNTVTNSLLPSAIVQVKLYQSDVSPELVHAFGGVTDHSNGAIGYLIAAGGFAPYAAEQAKNYPLLRLVDGQMLLRYMTYILGARLAEDTKTVLPLEALFEADQIRRRSLQETVLMAIANEKGGVGKTTSAINLGTWLGQQGKRVLLIDLDTQSNLTGRMPLRHEPGKDAVLPTMVDYFLGQKKLSELILPTKYDNVYTIASTESVKLTGKGVNDWTKSFLAFARDLHAAEVKPPVYEAPSFDWMILDTPTADEYRIRLALAAAHVVVAPVIPGIFGFAGLNALLASVESMKALTGSGLGKKGCFMTYCDSLKVKSLQGYFEELRPVLNNWHVPLFQNTIPRLPSIETAHINQRSFFRLGRPDLSAAARAYKALGEEIVSYVSQ